jgi:hypothetical protein
MDGLRLVFPPAASAPIIYGMGHVYRYVMPSEGLACFAFAGCLMVGRCRLNQVDPCPITYSLSNP